MKKFKILILTLVLFALPLMANNIDAQTINSVYTQNVFSSIGDFFGNLFGGNQDTLAHSSELRDIDADVDTADEFAKNTAYGCDGEDNCDNGTDVIDLSNIDGIDIDKDMVGSDGTNLGTTGAPLVADETVNITLQITNTGNIDDKASVTITDPLIEDYILYSGSVKAKTITDKDSDMAGSSATVTTAATLNSTTATEVSTDVYDLREANGGIVIDNMDAGDQVQLTFTGKVKTNRPEGTTSSVTENDAQACKPYVSMASDIDAEYDYIHVNEAGEYDGTIFGTSGAYTLCDTGSDDIYVVWDDETVDPGVPSLSAEKSVTDNPALSGGTTGIAEPGETLTYSFFIQNEGDAEGTFILKDPLDDPSLVNNTDITTQLAASSPQKLVSQYGDLTLNQDSSSALYGEMDAAADALTIADLPTGIAVTLAPEEYLEVSFTLTVNATIDYFSLHEGTDIYNIATVCEDKAVGAACSDIEGLIPVDPAFNLEVDKNVVKVDGTAVADGEVAVIDTTSTGTGPVGVNNGINKHEVTYQVTFENNSNSTEDVTLKDDRSSVYLEIPATPNNALTVVGTVGSVTTTDALTVDALTNPGINATMGPESSVTIKYTLYTTEQLQDDIDAGKTPTADQLANIASSCLKDTTDCDEDGGLVGVDVDPMEDGKIDIIKSSQVTGTDPDSGNAIEGSVATYTFEINNDTNESQVIYLNDPLDDQSFNHTVSDSNSLYLSEEPLDAAPMSAVTIPTDTAAVAHAKFVDATGADVTGYTVGDLSTADKVYVELAPDAVTYLSFDMTLTLKDADPDVDDTTDVENTVTACVKSTAASTKFDDCTDGGNVIDLVKTNSLRINKEVTDPATPGTKGLAEPGELLSYTITVKNEGTDTIDTVKITDKILSGFYDEDYIADTANKATVTVDGGSLVTPADGIPADGTGKIALADLYDTEAGIEVANLAPSGTITITFDVLLKDDGTGVWPEDISDIVGQQVANTACANFAEAARIGTVTNVPNVDACSTAELPTSPTDTIDPEDGNVNVEKQITDEESTGDINGIAEAGETLTIKFVVTNETDTVETVRIEEMEAFDPNLDYSASLTEAIDTVPADSLVTSMSDDTPVTMTVGDLIKVVSDPVTDAETVTMKAPMYVLVQPESTVTVSFNVKVVGTYFTSTPPTIEYNNAIYTDDETITGDLTEDNSTPIVGTIPTPGYEDLSILKTVEDSTAADGSTELTGTFVDGTTGYYGEASGLVDYNIRVENTGTLPVQDLVLHDLINTDYFKDTVGGSAISVAVNSSDGVYTAVTGTLDQLNLTTSVAYPSTGTETFDPGETLDVSFTAELRDDLDTYFNTGEMIPNTAEVCYKTTSPYNVDFPTAGTYCYSSGVDLPLIEDGGDITGVDPDDPDFAIEKRSDVGSDNILSPGEPITYNIYVTNNGIPDVATGEVAESQSIVVTDEMFDENILYNGDAAASIPGVDTVTLNVENLGIIGGAGDAIDPIVEILNDTAWEDNSDLTTNPIPAYYLLPKSGDTWVSGTPASGDWRLDLTKYPDLHRGGIRLTIPANNTYVISFTVNASGDFKTIDRVKNFFDFKRFF